MSKCDDCFIYNNDEFSGMECCSTNCNDVKKWLAEHDMQIRNEVIGKIYSYVKRECNPYGKPTLDFESGKQIMNYLEKMKGE